MLIESTELKGLDLRSSDQNRDPFSASDLSNVELDSRRRLRTRFGYEFVAALPEGVTQVLNYGHGDEVLAIGRNGLHRFNLVEKRFDEVFYSGLDGVHPVWNGPVSTAEWRGVLYIADTLGENNLFKYDGSAYYRAGVPQPVVNLWVPEDAPGNDDLLQEGGIFNNFFWKFILKHTDNQGNVTYGDSFLLRLEQRGEFVDVLDRARRLIPEPFRTVNNVKTTPPFWGTLVTSGQNENLVESLYARVELTNNPSVFKFPNIGVSGGELTALDADGFTLTFPGDIRGQVNDEQLILVGFGVAEIFANVPELRNDPIHRIPLSEYKFQMEVLEKSGLLTTIIQERLRVQSKTFAGGMTSLRFAYEQPPTIGEGIRVPIQWSSGFEFVVAVSSNELTGYNILNSATIDNLRINGGLSENDVSRFKLSDVYDDNSPKYVPPLMKHITMHGIHLVGGNAPLVQNSRTNAQVGSDQSIYWSDLHLGSSVETFSFDEDFRAIGDAGEGVITGLYSERNNLVVFKERQVFVISGALFEDQFRVSKLQTNEIGCASGNSIIEIDRGCAFVSSKGFYSVDYGGKVTELSDSIEPVFIDHNVNWRLARSYHSLEDEKFYIFASGRIYVFDYYHRQWFIFDNIPAEQGLFRFRNELYYAGGDKLYRRSGKTDAGKKINGQWTSGWFSSPSSFVKKTFPRISIIGERGNIEVESFRDWQDSPHHRKSSGKLSKANPLLTVGNPDPNLALASKFKISSSDMSISGIAVEMEVRQKAPR